MKFLIRDLLKAAVVELQQQTKLPAELSFSIQVERAKDRQHGDFASNIAMMLAKSAAMAPRQLAELIVAAMPTSELVEKVIIAGPGFINFFLAPKVLHESVDKALQMGQGYGRSHIGAGERINLEYVSANPTGPLHVGHGRGAAYGATLANLLDAVGYEVHSEYYVNDAGRQMHILAVSIWLRYLELHGQTLLFPKNGYKGDYVITIAQQLQQTFASDLVRPISDVFANVPADEAKDGSGDKEAHIDGLISNAKQLLSEHYQHLFTCGLDFVLQDIKQDLGEFGVKFDEWFLESQLEQSGAIQQAIARLKANNHLFEQEHALWFNSKALGDDKDRVVVRENGATTYFASDLAYMLSKFKRGYERSVYIFGADHHGYIPRLKAAAKAFDLDPEQIQIKLVQFAVLYRGDKKIPMSTRSGSFVTLRQLREEVGNDAARFFYVMRKAEHHMDFDLELAKEHSNENPVYYIQYAHARICSVFRQLEQREQTWQKASGLAHLAQLQSEHEKSLLTFISRYPELIEVAAINHEPHLLANFLREVATEFHGYYNASQFIVSDEALCQARLTLIMAVKQVLHNGLELLGLTAPEQMPEKARVS